MSPTGGTAPEPPSAFPWDAVLALGLAHGQLKLRTGGFGELVVDAPGQVRLLRWDERP